MKNLILILSFLMCSLVLSANNEPCKCTYPLKQNTCWTVGPKGGNYCINKNGSKTYKKKDNSLTTYPAKPTIKKTAANIK